MEKIKAIFFDFDWTLFDHTIRQIPASTIKGIEEAQKNEVKIYINSARSYYSLDTLHIFDLIKFDGYITQNGGCAFLNDKEFYVHSFNKKDINRLISFLEEKQLGYILSTKYTSYIKVFDEKIVDNFYSVFYEMRPKDISEYKGEDIVCIQIFCYGDMDKDIISLNPSFNYCRFATNCIEISPIEYKKSEGIDCLIKNLNYKKEELMAFGDEDNDIKMFNVVKYGICMGNGHEGAKKAAYYVTSPILEDGIYNALKHFNVI